MATGRILSQAAPQFLCPEGGEACSEQQWWSYLCLQVCWHSWETRSLDVIWVWSTVAQDQLLAEMEMVASRFLT